VCVFGYELLESRLVNRHHAMLESFNFLFINVNTGDVDSEFSKTSACNQTNVTSTDNGYMHFGSIEKLWGWTLNQNFAGRAISIA